MEVRVEDHTEEVIERTNAAIAVALEAIGLQAEGYVKLLCPVDTGRLRNSITHAPEGDKAEIIGTNVEYAPYVEYGTTRTKPSHFMKDGVQGHIAEYQQILDEYLKNA